MTQLLAPSRCVGVLMHNFVLTDERPFSFWVLRWLIQVIPARKRFPRYGQNASAFFVSYADMKGLQHGELDALDDFPQLRASISDDVPLPLDFANTQGINFPAYSGQEMPVAV